MVNVASASPALANALCPLTVVDELQKTLSLSLIALNRRPRPAKPGATRNRPAGFPSGPDLTKSDYPSASQVYSTRTSVTLYIIPVSTIVCQSYIILWTMRITHGLYKMTAGNDERSILGHLGQSPRSSYRKRVSNAGIPDTELSGPFQKKISGV